MCDSLIIHLSSTPFVRRRHNEEFPRLVGLGESSKAQIKTSVGLIATKRFMIDSYTLKHVLSEYQLLPRVFLTICYKMRHFLQHFAAN